jgi:hypothetical protein
MDATVPTSAMPLGATTDFRPCPFCAHAEPMVVTIAGEQPAYVIACPECGATGPKRLPGVPVEVAIDTWNRRFGVDH